MERGKDDKKMSEETKTVLSGGIGEAEIRQALQTLNDYKQGRSVMESRIVEEEQWWKLRHWDTGGMSGDLKPVSAWLFNSLNNKHADAMDNYPEPNVLPRERSDEKTAATLSSVLPVIMERNSFEQVYSDAWWYKLKHGAACYGIFWNKDSEDTLGDVDITYIDLLNVFWEPGIRNIQDSRNLFIVSLVDTDIIESRYPETRGKAASGGIDIKEYVYDDNIDRTKKSVVIDWYYKKYASDGRRILHYCKFVGDTVIFATENEPEYRERGWYEHGKYPIVLDVLYPEEGTAVGFGLISIMKDPQMYIDKLNELLLKNIALRAKPRYFAKEMAGINMDEFLDLSKTVVHVQGSLGEESLRRIEVDDAPTSAFNMLQFKVDELKETSSNRDVSQGGSSSGITAAAAISALQEAGNKTSRDMILASYRAYTEMMYIVIDLIRQFYTESRCFRITGESGTAEYVEFNGSEMDGERRPIFDVVIKPQKRSAYSKLSQNELAKELYNLGFFNPQNAEPSLAAVEMMDFDGKQKVKEQIQRGQTLQAQLDETREQMTKMSAIIQGLTGENVMSDIGAAQSVPTAGGAKMEGSGSAGESYGERIARRAAVDVTRGAEQ